jgi:hypothetical protein
MDRFYYALSFATLFLSVGGVAAVAAGEVEERGLSVGALTAVLFAALTAHSGALNAMWALCVQGQTVTTLKRIINYLQLVEKEHKEHKTQPLPAITRTS